jgi:hypothetical protein
MMGYRVHSDDDKFKVVEVTGGEIKELSFGLSLKSAQSMARSLNFGGGFDGRTPDFFLNKLQVSV